MSTPYFQCDNCEATYQYDAALVGTAVRCRTCGYVFRVPSQALVELTQSTSPQQSVVTGTGRWFLRFPNGRQFGPVVEQVLREWVAEERANAQSWVLEEGTETWKQLGVVFATWFGPPPEANPYEPVDLPICHLPAVGFLDRLDDELGVLGNEEAQAHLKLRDAVAKECQQAGGYVVLRAAKSFRVGEKLVFGETDRLPEEARPESVLVCALASQTSEFYLVVPWSRIGRLPHEFFSVLPGRLPSSMALRRQDEEAFGDGKWVGICGTENDVLAVAAKRSKEELTRGLRTEWLSDNRSYTMTLVWGLQAVPLGDEKFIHLIQSAAMGASQADFGLLWYLERQSAFYRFARRLSLPQDHETHFLYSTCAGQLLVRSFGQEPN
jgi:hypothetical protein